MASRLKTEPELIPWSAVRALDAQTTAGWVSQPLLDLVRRELPFSVSGSHEPPPGAATVVVIGGGTMIDRAKLWRRAASPATRLVAVPSLWGSGAEASPVALRSEGGRKVAEMDAALLPDQRAIWPELARHVPPDAARWGCGDVWSHALEAFFSPLAGEELRAEAAAFLREDLLPQPLAAHPRWYELAARACALQARSGVGLVHGAAHELEPVLGEAWGHARLCSALLGPVMRFNASQSAKVRALIEQWGLPWGDILRRLDDLAPPADFAALAPLLQAHWGAIVRHPLTRINAALVRPDAAPQLQAAAVHEPAS